MENIKVRYGMPLVSTVFGITLFLSAFSLSFEKEDSTLLDAGDTEISEDLFEEWDLDHDEILEDLFEEWDLNNDSVDELEVGLGVQARRKNKIPLFQRITMERVMQRIENLDQQNIDDLNDFISDFVPYLEWQHGRVDMLEAMTEPSTVVCKWGMTYTGLRNITGHLILAKLTKNSSDPILCDPLTDGGGWVVFQRRPSIREYFNRTWENFKRGFGSIYQDFWLGNEYLAAITKEGKHELRIDFKTMNGTYYAKYSSFKVAPEQDKFKLTVSGFSGNVFDAFSSHSGSKFSTYDSDNDIQGNASCAQLAQGSWWYFDCYESNLNAGSELYNTWTTSNSTRSLVIFSQMMTRPKW